MNLVVFPLCLHLSSMLSLSRITVHLSLHEKIQAPMEHQAVDDKQHTTLDALGCTIRKGRGKSQ